MNLKSSVVLARMLGYRGGGEKYFHDNDEDVVVVVEGHHEGEGLIPVATPATIPTTTTTIT